MHTIETFLRDFMAVAPLRGARNLAMQDWGKDIPMTLLFSLLGKAIAENFVSLSSDERHHLFHLIELGMETDNPTLRTLVATGLLEGMHSKGSQNVTLWRQIDSELGKLAKTYLFQWLNHC